MRDDILSKYMRDTMKLHADFRVYRIEALDAERIQIEGALARPATEHDSRSPGMAVWFKPFQGRRKMIITDEVYRGLFKNGTPE